jgi:hypothetical protein
MGVGLSVPACAGFFHTADLRTPFPSISLRHPKRRWLMQQRLAGCEIGGSARLHRAARTVVWVTAVAPWNKPSRQALV